MLEWMFMPLKRYAEFSGRSRRKEYWMFTLLVVLIYLVFLALMFATMGAGFAGALSNPAALVGFGSSLAIFGILFFILMLAIIVPGIAVTIRRLHDRNMSGWYLLGYIVAVVITQKIPVIGGLLYAVVAIGWLVLLCLEGTRGPNKYGPDPKDPTSAEVFA